jgi:predicted GNAT family acetyltransferase
LTLPYLKVEVWLINQNEVNMSEVKLNLNEVGHGAFYAMDGPEQLGKMVVGIKESELTVYHTEVSHKAEGQGIAKKMLDEMVAYSRAHDLKVIPLCPYVLAQFKRHP